MQRQRVLRGAQPNRSQQQQQQVQNGYFEDSSETQKLTSTQRHLEDLERSNYLEPSGDGDGRGGGGGGNDGFGEWTSGVKDEIARQRRKKDVNVRGGRGRTLEVRNLLIYRKTFKTLLEESGLQNLSPHIPSYISARAGPPKTKREERKVCASCGFFGHYACGRCDLRYCSRECKVVHDETRCEKRGRR